MVRHEYLEIEVFWIREKIDLCKCSECNKMIDSDMYTLILFVNKTKFKATDIKLCSLCYNKTNI